MGQQQILLIIVVVIIVGIATLVAIQLFRSEEVIFMEDEYTQIMIEVAEEVQAWYLKPEQLGGGGGSFKSIDFNNVACPFGEVNQGQPTMCSDRKSGSNVTYMNLYNAFPGYAILSTGIRINNVEYRSELHIYPERVDWAKEWTKQ